MHILGGQSLTRQRSYRLHSFHPFLESCVSRRSLMKKIHIVFQSEISENDDKDREPHSRQILQFQNFPARIRRTCRLANPFLNLLVRLDKHPPKLSARESGFKFTCKAWTGVLISLLIPADRNQMFLEWNDEPSGTCLAGRSLHERRLRRVTVRGAAAASAW